METKQYVWRGAYGDKAPVRVHMTQALDFYGGLEAEHFESEEAAWGSILAYAEQAVGTANARYSQANRGLDEATALLVECRCEYRKICSAFDAWKARHPKAAAV